ncbi:uncharacterized protein LOC132693916 [Panthera onca]
MDWDNIWVCMPPKSSREGQPDFAKGSHCGIYNRDKLLHLLPLEKQNIGMGRRLIMKGRGRRPVLGGLSHCLRCWISRRKQNRFWMTFRKAGVIIWERKSCLFFSKVRDCSPGLPIH